MSSQFDLSTVLTTIGVASVRVLPDFLDEPTFGNLFNLIEALNPVVTSFWLTVILANLQVFLSIATFSCAWNDRMWSLIPPIYAFLFAVHPILSHDRRTNSSFDYRLTLMSALVFAWGIRLTFNAARRGFYNSGFVDYRYTWIRSKRLKSRVLFSFVYATCICHGMTVLLALASSPFYFAWVRRGRSPELTTLDFIAAAGMLGSICLETVADNQQHAFHAQKLKWRDQDCTSDKVVTASTFSNPLVADVRDGFLQSGLFAWSRHPNFFSEMCVWWFFYLFSVSTSGRWFNWTLMGPVAYTALFQFTTPLTEGISEEKYPAYKDYKARVSRLIPWPLSSRTRVRENVEKKED